MAFWIPKATNTHSEHVIVNAFPLQQWLHERASVLLYTNVGCLVKLLPSFQKKYLSFSLFLTSECFSNLGRVLKEAAFHCDYKLSYFANLASCTAMLINFRCW